MADEESPENEPAPWAPDEPTAAEPLEQQRSMKLDDPQSWSTEPAYPGPSGPQPWAQTQYRYAPPPPPPPLPQTAPYPASSGSSARVVWLAVALVAVVVVAVVAVIAVQSGRKSGGSSSASGGGSNSASPYHGGSSSSGGLSNVTKCSSPPAFSIQDASTDQNRLTVKLRITASCSGGDVLSSSATRIAIAATDGLNVAAGTFDLSSNPIYVPRPDEGTVDQQFVFGADSYWIPLGTMGDQYTAASPGYQVQLSESGSAPTDSGSPASSSIATATATGPAQPVSGDAQDAASHALPAIASADEPIIMRDLADRWVPQVSSKWIGLDWHGIHWDDQAILQEHLELRSQFQSVRLMWTPNWSTFDGRPMWVTVVGNTSSDSGGALDWCRQYRNDHDLCYAKLISKTLPAEGSTELLPG